MKPALRGLIDLHVHYLPGIDDGVRSAEDGLALLQALGAIGYARCVATPHMRTAMYPNERAGLESTFASLAARAEGRTDLPELGLAAEHFFDDVFLARFAADQALPYPGGHAVLVELQGDHVSRALGQRFYELHRRGVRVVLAHPERYGALHRSLDVIEPLLDLGVLLQLDVMSLVDQYGTQSRRTAERLLADGAYFLACSDAHKPSDVPIVARAIEVLRKHLGDDEALELLSANPRSVLDGTFE